jgi:hypothetical protein
MPGSLWSVLGAIAVGVLGIFSFRTRGAAAAEVADESRRVA